MSLLVLPLLGWVFDERCQDYERAFVKVLDTVAHDLAMVNLGSHSASTDKPKD